MQNYIFLSRNKNGIICYPGFFAFWTISIFLGLSACNAPEKTQQASSSLVPTGIIPTLDISSDTTRQVVIARGTEEIYQGHPTTVLLPDGKTMYCVWTYDHGGVCGPMKRSDDGGLTWSSLLDVPDNWNEVRNCPTIYRLPDPQGDHRRFVFAGQGPDGKINQSYSENQGKTWTPMQSNGLEGVMPFCTVMSVDEGKKLLAMTNIRRPGETEEERSNVIAQSVSEDGGFTWSPWKVVLDLPGLKPCEPELVRSPYVKYRTGPEKNSVVSARFRLSQTDSLVASASTNKLLY